MRYLFLSVVAAVIFMIGFAFLIAFNTDGEFTIAEYGRAFGIFFPLILCIAVGAGLLMYPRLNRAMDEDE